MHVCLPVPSPEWNKHDLRQCTSKGVEAVIGCERHEAIARDHEVCVAHDITMRCMDSAPENVVASCASSPDILDSSSCLRRQQRMQLVWGKSRSAHDCMQCSLSSSELPTVLCSRLLLSYIPLFCLVRSADSGNVLLHDAALHPGITGEERRSKSLVGFVQQGVYNFLSSCRLSDQM